MWLALFPLVLLAQVRTAPDVNLRDSVTGHWLIGLYRDGAAYDARFWKYAYATADSMVLQHGSQTIGVRQQGNDIVIGGKTYRCTTLTTPFLPDFPLPDTALHAPMLVDSIGKAAIRVQLKNRRPGVRVYLQYFNPITSKNKRIMTTTDSGGRVEMLLPLTCSSMVEVQVGQQRYPLVMAPHSQVLLFADDMDRGAYVMGFEARTNNEEVAFNGTLPRTMMPPEVRAFSEALAQCRKGVDAYAAELEKYRAVRPNLSAKFVSRHKGRAEERRALRLKAFHHVIHGFAGSACDCQKQIDAFAYHLHAGPYEMPLDAMAAEFLQGVQPRLEAVPTSAGYVLSDLAALCSAIGSLKPLDASLVDIMKAQAFYRAAVREYAGSMPPVMVAMMDSLVAHPSLRRGVQYELENTRRLAAFTSMTHEEAKLLATRPLTDFRDGKSIMKRLLAPHWGRNVLVSLWGTWSAPSNTMLAEQLPVARRQLAGKPLSYMFVAVRSPHDHWQTHSARYLLQGADCDNLLLSKPQQQALSLFLGVDTYPSTYLFDTTGRQVIGDFGLGNVEKIKAQLAAQP